MHSVLPLSVGPRSFSRDAHQHHSLTKNSFYYCDGRGFQLLE